jgi:hypothetical protein
MAFAANGRPRRHPDERAPVYADDDADRLPTTGGR